MPLETSEFWCKDYFHIITVSLHVISFLSGRNNLDRKYTMQLNNRLTRELSHADKIRDKGHDRQKPSSGICIICIQVLLLIALFTLVGQHTFGYHPTLLFLLPEASHLCCLGLTRWPSKFLTPSIHVSLFNFNGENL